MAVTDALVRAVDYDAQQLALLARTIAQGCDADELALFAAVCRRTGLDPFTRQIYAIRRYDSREDRDVMTIQVSIDGLRVLAMRSGKYGGQLGPWWADADGQVVRRVAA